MVIIILWRIHLKQYGIIFDTTEILWMNISNNLEDHLYQVIQKRDYKFILWYSKSYSYPMSQFLTSWRPQHHSVLFWRRSASSQLGCTAARSRPRSSDKWDPLMPQRFRALSWRSRSIGWQLLVIKFFFDQLNLSKKGSWGCPMFLDRDRHFYFAELPGPDSNPIIEGGGEFGGSVDKRGKAIYKPGDLLNLTCESAPSNPPATLEWLVNGQKVSYGSSEGINQ